MAVVVAVVLVAIGIGLTRGGSLLRLSTLTLPGWPLVVASLGVQVLGGLIAERASESGRGSSGGAAYAVALLISALLVSAFVVRNRTVPGMPLVAAGFALNALVVGVNGGMPVSAWAASRAGLDAGGVVRASARHEPADRGTRLRVLGDVIPAPMPLARASSVLSPGDVVLAAGIGTVVLRGMTVPVGRGRRDDAVR